MDLNVGSNINPDLDLIRVCDDGLLELLVLNKTGFVFHQAPNNTAGMSAMPRLCRNKLTCAHSDPVVDGTMLASATLTIFHCENE